MPSTFRKMTHDSKRWHGRHLSCHFVATKQTSVCPGFRLLKVADTQIRRLCFRKAPKLPFTAAW